MGEDVDYRFSRAFLDGMAEVGKSPTVPPALDALERCLTDLGRRVQDAWPDLALDMVEFQRYVGSRVDGPDVLKALAGIHAADLFLAFGCSKQDDRSLRELDAHFLQRASAEATAKPPFLAAKDEILQALRDRMLVSAPGNPPRIATYSGRGPLLAWLRVSATRTALDLTRRAHLRDAHLDDRVPEPAAKELDPELQYLKDRYGRELSEVFRSILVALPARQATVLRLHFLDGVNAHQIGELYEVNARTIQRWIAEARASILEQTKRVLAERLHCDEAELASIIRLAQSQIDVTISIVLRDHV